MIPIVTPPCFTRLARRAFDPLQEEDDRRTHRCSRILSREPPHAFIGILYGLERRFLFRMLPK
jgi:hypothetical protein